MRRAISLILLTVAACSHASKAAPTPVVSPPPAPVAALVAPVPAAPAPASKICQADTECPGSELCLSSRCVPIDASTTACDGLAIHFDLDEALIRQVDAPVLQRESRCLNAKSGSRIKVSGNCDERGTAAYNLALGHRRAVAAQRYLTDLGVPASRIETVSYGKERPRCTEHAEACWAVNRRDDLDRQP